MKLTEENYYSTESDAAYLSYSQLKAFLACEAAAMYADHEPPTTAMLVGSYVDAWFEGTLDKFQAENPQIFKKDGSLTIRLMKTSFSGCRKMRCLCGTCPVKSKSS